MRIVAGAHRGRLLVAPKGHSTRPTADRTRQALLNVLEHAAWSPGVAGLRIIDLFAGSGALGLEALSRGASFCLLVDTDPAALAAISENITGLRLSDRCEVRRWDATRLPTIPAISSPPVAGGDEGGPYDIAFLDPPYGKSLAEPALGALLSGGWLAPDALVVVERGADEGHFAPAGFHTLDSRVWGAARVWFLQPAPPT
jgi:16S rRNA (guanine966-N2)-methyltransferase